MGIVKQQSKIHMLPKNEDAPSEFAVPKKTPPMKSRATPSIAKTNVIHMTARSDRFAQNSMALISGFQAPKLVAQSQ